MEISRTIYRQIKENIVKGDKIVILYGPRQAGKTTLLKKLQNELGAGVLFLNGDDLYVQEILSKSELEKLKKIVGDKSIIIIDEAQRIENIGLSLKLLFDELRIKIIVSGSSSFDLANRLSEPLTGRTRTFFLYPISLPEILPLAIDARPAEKLEEILRFGLYAKVLSLSGEDDKQSYLTELLNNYLYKDILAFGGVRKPKKVVDLLSLLALQIGQQASINELGRHLALSRLAIERYLDVLEKMFVIVNLRGFSRNLRKEIYKTSKYYFIDLGLRNALIRNFNSLKLRTDSGAMFENFCIIERIKAANNLNRPANFYFWRTYGGEEIDLIEERGGKLYAWECKLSATKKIMAPKSWNNAYPQSEFTVINTDNCFDELVQ